MQRRYRGCECVHVAPLPHFPCVSVKRDVLCPGDKVEVFLCLKSNSTERNDSVFSELGIYGDLTVYFKACNVKRGEPNR